MKWICNLAFALLHGEACQIYLIYGDQNSVGVKEDDFGM